MKCPKCGYNSFDHLNDCRKCGQDLSDHKGKFGLHSLLFSGKQSSQKEPSQNAEPPADEESGPSGFDFMGSEENPIETKDSPLEDLLAEEKEAPAPSVSLPAAAESAWDEPEEVFGEPAAQSAPVSSPETTAPESKEENPFEMVGGEESDFDLSWEEENPLPEPEEFTPAGADEFPEWDGPALEAEEEETDPAPEREEPVLSEAEEELTGIVTSPEEEEPETADEAPAPLPDHPEPEPDLASLFLDSLEDSSDSEGSLEIPEDYDPFAPDDSEPESCSGGLPGGAFDFGGAEPLPASNFAIDEKESSEPTLPEEASDLPAEEETEPSEAEEEPPTTTKPGLVSRIGAGTADLLLLFLIFALFVAAGELALAPGDRGRLLPSVARLAELSIPYFLVLFALSFGYFTLFHFLTGQTPGKMVFGLRVETEEGTDLLLSQAFLRSVGGLLSILPAGLGYLRICLDPQGRGWNDRLAGSRVVPVHAATTEEGGTPVEMQEDTC